MKNLKNISYLIIATLLLIGCGKDESTNPDDLLGFDYSYFPTKVGTYIEYDVNELDVEVTVARFDTSFYHIREEIDSLFTDLEGRETLKIKRYRKETGQTEWRIVNVWTANLTKTTAERVEDNKRYIKLIFPATTDKEWLPNVYNDIDEAFIGPLEMTYTGVEQKVTVGRKTYDKVNTTFTKEIVPLISERKIEEKYASDIGLVYKNEKIFIRKSDGNPVPKFLDDIHKEVTMTATSYGVIK